MERDDLRAIKMKPAEPAFQEGWDLVEVSDADLASLGYVKLPVCRECYGSGDRVEVYHPLGGDPPERSVSPCPSCGGTGFLGYVKLDGIDVEALREAVDDHMGTSDDYANEYMPVAKDHHFTIVATARQVLAAIDKGDTDV